MNYEMVSGPTNTGCQNLSLKIYQHALKLGTSKMKLNTKLSLGPLDSLCKYTKKYSRWYNTFECIEISLQKL